MLHAFFSCRLANARAMITLRQHINYSPATKGGTFNCVRCASVSVTFGVTFQWADPLIRWTFNPDFRLSSLGRGLVKQTLGKHATILGHLFLQPTHYIQSCSKVWTFACARRVSVLVTLGAAFQLTSPLLRWSFTRGFNSIFWKRLRQASL